MKSISYIILLLEGISEHVFSILILILRLATLSCLWTSKDNRDISVIFRFAQGFGPDRPHSTSTTCINYSWQEFQHVWSWKRFGFMRASFLSDNGPGGLSIIISLTSPHENGGIRKQTSTMCTSPQDGHFILMIKTPGYDRHTMPDEDRCAVYFYSSIIGGSMASGLAGKGRENAGKQPESYSIIGRSFKINSGLPSIYKRLGGSKEKSPEQLVIHHVQVLLGWCKVVSFRNLGDQVQSPNSSHTGKHHRKKCRKAGTVYQ